MSGPPASGPDLNPVTLADRYPWPATGKWLRAVMVMTLIGADAGPDGRTRSISCETDLAVLLANRVLADAVVIGAGTMRTERYRPLRVSAVQRDLRVQAGRTPAPQLVVVSGRGELPWSDPVFTESDLPVLVITGDEQPPPRPSVGVEVVRLPGGHLPAEAIVTALTARGLLRITCEGGRSLLTGLAAAELVDEWALTVSPLAGSARYRLASTWSAEGFLFTRFTGSPHPPSVPDSAPPATSAPAGSVAAVNGQQ